jgi:hypothetical protein
LTGLSPGLRVGVGLALAAALPAQPEPAPPTSGRAATAQALKEAYRYDPAIRERALDEASADPDVIQLPRVMVTDTKLESLLDRLFTARRRAADANRPSLANGAATDRVLAGRPVRVGVQPYRELLEEEAKFRVDGPAVAPWTLLDMKF